MIPTQDEKVGQYLLIPIESFVGTGQLMSRLENFSGAKHISLNEDAIKMKATAFSEVMFPLKEYVEIQTESEQNQFALGRTSCQIAYKQALKDILK